VPASQIDAHALAGVEHRRRIHFERRKTGVEAVRVEAVGIARCDDGDESRRHECARRGLPARSVAEPVTGHQNGAAFETPRQPGIEIAEEVRDRGVGRQRRAADRRTSLAAK
jgi:hypothetical protein